VTAEYARVPFADHSLIPVPLTHETTNLSIEMDFVALSDIWATAWQALDDAGFLPGDTVAVFGAGPVGLLAAYSAIIRGASKAYLVDRIAMRLECGRSFGAIPIDFSTSDAVDQILSYEPLGVQRVVDCVGMEAVDKNGNPDQGLVTRSMVRVAAQNGGLGQVGVYGAQNNTSAAPKASSINPDISFPLTDFFMKGLSLKGGIVNPRALAPQLLALIAQGRAHPGLIASAVIPIADAPHFYDRFSEHKETKVYINFKDAR
jgi:threonine dehydrogenase-like Zn-dependent dehydrogenase